MKDIRLGLAVAAFLIGVPGVWTAHAENLLSSADEVERFKTATIDDWNAARDEAKIDWSRFVYIRGCIKDRRGENAEYSTTEVHPGGERARRCIDGWAERFRKTSGRLLDISIWCGNDPDVCR